MAHAHAQCVHIFAGDASGIQEHFVNILFCLWVLRVNVSFYL